MLVVSVFKPAAAVHNGVYQKISVYIVFLSCCGCPQCIRPAILLLLNVLKVAPSVHIIS